MFTALSYFALFWTCIHLAHRIYQRRHSPLLPSLRASLIRQTTVDLKPLRLHVSSTALNASHDALNRRLTHRTSNFRRVVELFYDLGGFAGLLGSVGSLGLLAFTTLQLCVHLLSPTPVASTEDIHSFSKRVFNEISSISTEGNLGGFAIQPIIPGLTVPLSHFPLIFAALFTSQFIHEAGHFLSAALTATPLHSVGISLVYVIPSAFVALSSHQLRNQGARVRLRIAAAGAWHNMLLYAFLVALGTAGFGEMLQHAAGYSSQAFGRVVVKVDQDSALQTYILPGSIILALNDVSLAAPTPSQDLWENSLLGPNAPMTVGGWCADNGWFASQSKSCCPPDAQPKSNGLEACFLPLSASDARCIDPVSFFVEATPRRCTVDVDCHASSADSPSAAHWVCVHPHERERLLRIMVHVPYESNPRVVLWSGPRDEVYEQVQVSALNHNWAPLWIPDIIATFFDYVRLITLSLALLNLLPLPMLDGAQVLEAALEFITKYPRVRHGQESVIELEDVESGVSNAWRRVDSEDGFPNGRRVQWQITMQQAVMAATWIGIITSTLLGFIVWILGNPPLVTGL